MNFPVLYHNDWLASRRIVSVVLANTDGTPVTGAATNKCKLLKNGSAGGAGSDSTNGLTALDSSRGSYELALTQTEYDLGRLRVSYHAAGVIPFVRSFWVEPCPDAWSGTAYAGGVDYVDLPEDPVAVYGVRIEKGDLLQLSKGAGAPALAVIDSYTAGTKRVVVDANWNSQPNNTTVVRILKGPLPPPPQAVDVARVDGSQDAAETLGKMAQGGAPGAVVAGTITRTSIPTDKTSLDADHFAGRTMLFRTGNLTDQARPILGNTVGGLFAVDDWLGNGTGFTRAPGVGDEFVIV